MSQLDSEKKYTPSDFRLVTRMQQDGRAFVGKKDDGTFAVVEEGKVRGVFQFKKDANILLREVCKAYLKRKTEERFKRPE